MLNASVLVYGGRRGPLIGRRPIRYGLVLGCHFIATQVPLNTSHRNKVLPQDTRHRTQRPCYQRGSLCQDAAGNRTSRRRDRQLKWYGHVSRSLGLTKTILQGTVNGGGRRGRQKKRWEDNIREWTGLEFAKSQRAMENRKKKKKMEETGCEIVCVPQRPSWLGDR